MCLRFSDSFKQPIALLLIGAILCASSGCATIVRGTSQTVTVSTRPAGQKVYYEGVEISDGESLTVRRDFHPPQFVVGDKGRPVMINMTYDPDVWLIGDAAWLLFGVIPGIIAGGVDVGTGAWRNLHETQYVYIPEGYRTREQAAEQNPKDKKEAGSQGTLTQPIEP